MLHFHPTHVGLEALLESPGRHVCLFGFHILGCHHRLYVIHLSLVAGVSLLLFILLRARSYTWRADSAYSNQNRLYICFEFLLEDWLSLSVYSHPPFPSPSYTPLLAYRTIFKPNTNYILFLAYAGR